MRLFTPRNPKSSRSCINKERVHGVTEQWGTTAGILLAQKAPSIGSWTVYDEIEDLAAPSDLTLVSGA